MKKLLIILMFTFGFANHALAETTEDRLQKLEWRAEAIENAAMAQEQHEILFGERKI